MTMAKFTAKRRHQQSSQNMGPKSLTSYSNIYAFCTRPYLHFRQKNQIKYSCKITKSRQITSFGKKITVFAAIAENHGFHDFHPFVIFYCPYTSLMQSVSAYWDAETSV